MNDLLAALPRRLGRTLLLASTVLAGGCASVPLATMWQMRNFGPEQLATVEPDKVRVAARVMPIYMTFKPEGATLSMDLTGKNGTVDSHVWTLLPTATAPTDLLPAGEPGWQAFKLTPDSVADLEALRPNLAHVEDDYKSATLRVAFKFDRDESKPLPDSITLSTRVSLSPAQSAFTLLDEMELPFVNEDEQQPTAP